MNDQIKGSLNVTLPCVFIAKPTEAGGYLIAAQAMLEGALPLGQIKPLHSFALTLLCGHACEAALKAALAQSGISAKELCSKRYGHSILKLWGGCCQYRGAVARAAAGLGCSVESRL